MLSFSLIIPMLQINCFIYCSLTNTTFVFYFTRFTPIYLSASSLSIYLSSSLFSFSIYQQYLMNDTFLQYPDAPNLFTNIRRVHRPSIYAEFSRTWLTSIIGMVMIAIGIGLLIWNEVTTYGYLESILTYTK